MASATISKAPTRTATGTRVRTCSCGKTITETIPAIPYTTDLAEGIYTITSKCGSGLKVSTRSINGYFDVYICDGDYSDQYWLFSKNSDGTYTIENAYYNDRVLDVENIYMFNAGEICTSTYNGGDNQKFYIVPFGDGYYKFVAKHSYLNLDNVNASTQVGNGLIQCYDNGSDAQRWSLKLSNPPLSLSSSSVNVSAGSSKTVNCTVGRETRGVTSSYSIANTSVCSASWGSWNGMACPLIITGKAGGTATITVKLMDYDTGIVYGTKTITVTVPGAAYTLTYNANGGTGAPASQTGSGSITLSTAKPTRSGYTFKGWATNAGATTAQYSAGASYNLTGNATLYAVWQKNATPAQATVKAVSISDFTINYRFSTTLKPQITADEGAKYSVKYESSNPNVASVDNNGRVTGEKRGAAVITCTVTDEYGNEAKDTCVISVDYTVWQWIIIILLFGWFWYI